LIPPRSCLNSTRAPLSTPFPYTTLFRSLPSLADQDQVLRLGTRIAPSEPPSRLPRRRERLVVAAPEPIKPTLANLALTSRTEAQSGSGGERSARGVEAVGRGVLAQGGRDPVAAEARDAEGVGGGDPAPSGAAVGEG